MSPLISSLLNTLLLAVMGSPDSIFHFTPLPCFNLRQLGAYCTSLFHLLGERFEEDFNDCLSQYSQKLSGAVLKFPLIWGPQSYSPCPYKTLLP